MNQEEEDVILLERPVIFVEPDALVDDDVGFEDVTTEYMLAQVDNDYDEVVVEQPDEVVIIEEIVLADVEPIEDVTLERKVA